MNTSCNQSDTKLIPTFILCDIDRRQILRMNKNVDSLFDLEMIHRPFPSNRGFRLQQQSLQFTQQYLYLCSQPIWDEPDKKLGSRDQEGNNK